MDIDEQQQLEDYLGSLKELMNHKGWKYLMEDFQQDLMLLNNLETINTPEELMFRKGQVFIISSLLNYEARLEAIESNGSPI